MRRFLSLPLLEKQLFSPGSVAGERAGFHGSCEDPGWASLNSGTLVHRRIAAAFPPQTLALKGKKRSEACMWTLIFLDLIYLGEARGEWVVKSPSLLANASFVPEIRKKPELDYGAL